LKEGGSLKGKWRNGDVFDDSFGGNGRIDVEPKLLEFILGRMGRMPIVHLSSSFNGLKRLFTRSPFFFFAFAVDLRYGLSFT